MQLKYTLKATIISLAVFFAGKGQTEVEDNQGYREAYQAWAGAHLTLLPTSFLPGPIGMGADLLSIPIDIRVKSLPASLIAPTPDGVIPNSPDGCHYDFELPQKAATYENLFGLFDITPLTENWGAFSNNQVPWVEHANAQVELLVDHAYLDPWSEGDKSVIFPSGNHGIKWQANTQIDPLIDIAIPIVLFVFTNEIKYSSSFLATEPGSAARAAKIGKEFLLNAGVEAGLIAAGQIDSNLPQTSATHTQTRPFIVYDVNPPTISTSDQNPAPLEANSFGGERWDVHKDQLRATITASDPCGQPVIVGNDAPFILPIGTTQVTWEAIDTGPLGGANLGLATVVQNITVQDTRAPIILAPPSRVIESNVAAITDDFDVGNAVVFDVADPNPTIDNTIGSGFNPDTRTEVIWTATDSSGNSDSKSQWITVKTPGTNTAPMVSDTSASGLTSEHIDLELSGNDNDLLSGRFDPLKFKITALPNNGFFVAPLMPYFIEDYRVRPGTVVGNILSNSPTPAADLDVAFCDNSQPIPIDFVYDSEFVHVDDTGTSYVLDRYWQCGSGLPTPSPRLSKWDADGIYQDQISINQSVKRITMDADGFIYAVTPGSSFDELFLNKYDQQLNSIDSWKLDTIPVSLGNPRLLGATMDSETGLIFATDKRRVYIFDGADGNFNPAFLGTLKNAENFLSGNPSVAGSSSRGFYIEIDSTGELYVVDSGDDRIHKFAATTYDGNSISIGEHIGWMGRCESGPGCDEENQRSIGYSCSDSTPCETLITDGSGQGQFNVPIGIALDPNDILYVTDYDNSRVQRFSPLGDYAGEAASTCDGSCFVLGDMGRPLDISVNSTQFYVLDNDRELMHVFETAPFKEITDDSVTVTYSSDNDFQGVDTFSYVANDGLVDSNVGTATIDINRNFRAPESFADDVITDEDEAVNIILSAADPDGILGVDFNGLDTLDYIITMEPQNGSLSGQDENLTYTPNADFTGQDIFTYKVNDGIFDSNEAAVSIQILPVNDQPVVNFTDENSKLLPKKLWPLIEGKIVGNDIQAGLGYPLPLVAEFTDPDLGQQHTVQITWGDGTVDNGRTDPPTVNPDEPSEDPLMTNTFNSTGQIFADHTYFSAGSKTVSLQVIDDQSLTSNPIQANIDVIPMVDVTLQDEEVDPDNFPDPGEVTAITIEVSNQSPKEPILGLTANNVVFTGTLPDDVTLINILTTQGSCSQVDQTSTCDLGSIEPDESVTITVIMQPDELFDPGKYGYTADVSSIEPDASVNNLAVFEIPIKFKDDIFANGFESN